jgi:hypothetical protein
MSADYVPCKWCHTITPMTGTHMCDPCYNLWVQLRSKPRLAAKMLDQLSQESIREKLLKKEKKK